VCGGFKPSRKFAIAKEDQVAAEMARLSNLKQGWTYTWPLSTGLEKKLFGGHCRIENLDSVWSGKIDRHVAIEASEFNERDTIGGSNQLKPFPVPSDKAIHGVVLKTGELRIVTKQAQGDVLKVHHRQPDFMEIIK
jgi:hypothetical protein